MRRLVLAYHTDPLIVRTRLAPGRNPWEIHPLLDISRGGPLPRPLLAINFVSYEALRSFHTALANLVDDYHTYLPAAERRLAESGRF